MQSSNPYLGKWRITEMEMWDQDYIDLETEGYFEFDEDGLGDLQFGTLDAGIDYRIESFCGNERLEFSWIGGDEDEMGESGRGWAVIKDGRLEGKIYFHLGDESWFKAKRFD